MIRQPCVRISGHETLSKIKTGEGSQDDVERVLTFDPVFQEGAMAQHIHQPGVQIALDSRSKIEAG